MKIKMRLELYLYGGAYIDKEISYEGANKKEIAKLIDKDQNDLLQYMQTGDKHGQEAFCFGGYIFKKDNIAAAQMSEPEY